MVSDARIILVVDTRRLRFPDVFVLGRFCSPLDRWVRNRFQYPPSVAEFPADFERTFTDSKPWFFSEHPLGQ